MRPRDRTRRRHDGAELEIVAHRELREDVAALRHIGDAAREQVARRKVGDVGAVEHGCGPRAPAACPKMVLKTVDLPAPFGPITVVMAPRAHRKASCHAGSSSCRSRRRPCRASGSVSGQDTPRSLWDRCRTSSGLPSAMRRPSASTTMREQSDITNSMLCSITTKVAPSRVDGVEPLAQVRRASSDSRRRPARRAARGAARHERHRGIEQLLLAVAQSPRPSRRQDERAGRIRSSGRRRR